MEVVGSASSPAGHALVRWITHSDLRQLAEVAGGISRREAFSSVLIASTELRGLAKAFIELQDARQGADYDNDYDYDYDYDVTAAEVFRLESPANKLILDTATMRGRDPSYHLFLRLALGAVKIARQR